jgi:hypothetical protein
MALWMAATITRGDDAPVGCSWLTSWPPSASSSLVRCSAGAGRASVLEATCLAPLPQPLRASDTIETRGKPRPLHHSPTPPWSRLRPVFCQQHHKHPGSENCTCTLTHTCRRTCASTCPPPKTHTTPPLPSLPTRPLHVLPAVGGLARWQAAVWGQGRACGARLPLPAAVVSPRRSWPPPGAACHDRRCVVPQPCGHLGLAAQPLWPGSNPTMCISYQQQADGLKASLVLASIVKVKVGRS